ncbi:amidohydrolase [Nitrosococcus oceani]|nr:amidohydrolase [Nitrosococcus oceani]
MRIPSKLLLSLMAVTLLITLAFSSTKAAPDTGSSTLYYGGSILTMEGSAPSYAEALVVKDGRILFVGTKTQAEHLAGAAAKKVDLDGRALLPGFIDAHGHVFNAGFQKLAANLLPPPDGGGKDVASLVALLKEWQDKNAAAIKKSGWIIGFGYDDSRLAEGRHPTAKELDQVSTELPVVIIHQSGHLAAMNHKGLELAGITAETNDPVGGVIRRQADGKTPNGVLEEMASFGPIFKILGALDSEANEKIALAGVDAYTQHGFTTAQEGRANKAATETWRKLADERKLKIDVAVYLDLQSEIEYIKQVGIHEDYTHHFRVAGVKLSLDGSPQGKTAWLSKPYLNPPPQKPDSYTGYPAIPSDKERQALFNLAYQKNWQLLVHCNGDAAAEAMIDAVAVASEKYGKDDRRTVMIHAQTVRESQLERMKKLGILPSFFSMHTYYWGDWHRDETLGPERAARISPTASALKRGMRFTEHHDAPVALPSAIMILHTTVNRTSRSGEVIGPDQRVSPYQALKSITDWAAWQYFEQDSKGTLTKGKLADLVILDQDPTQVDPATIMNIRVLETIKEGQTVYKAQ